MIVTAIKDAGVPAKDNLIEPVRKMEDDFSKFDKIKQEYRQKRSEFIAGLRITDFSSNEEFVQAKRNGAEKIKREYDKKYKEIYKKAVWVPTEQEDGQFFFRIIGGEKYKHADDLRFFELFEYKKNESKQQSKND